jgi:hypothetical protein
MGCMICHEKGPVIPVRPFVVRISACNITLGWLPSFPRRTAFSFYYYSLRNVLPKVMVSVHRSHEASLSIRPSESAETSSNASSEINNWEDEEDEEDIKREIERTNLKLKQLQRRKNNIARKKKNPGTPPAGSSSVTPSKRTHVRYSTGSTESNDTTQTSSTAENSEDAQQSIELRVHPVRGITLASAIEEKLVRSAFSKQRFLPKNDFKDLVTEATIQEELQAAGTGKPRHDLVVYIAEHAPKTFAALAYCDLLNKADSLPYSGFDDSYLPVTREKKRVTSLSGLPWDHPALQWFHDWAEQGMREFCEKQWLFLSKEFTSDSIMEDLHPDCRLPLLTYQTEAAGGSFSFLHKATIHHAHHVHQTMIEVSRTLT